MLVNNAGYGYLAAVEEGDDAEVRALFDTNYFGAVDMIKAVLPGMRAQRRAATSSTSRSMTGLVANPPNTYYSSTKFALEALTEGLAKEVGPLGIKVSAIEPGAFRTDWATRSMHETRDAIDDYAATSARARSSSRRSPSTSPATRAKVADAVLHGGRARRPAAPAPARPRRAPGRPREATPRCSPPSTSGSPSPST